MGPLAMGTPIAIEAFSYDGQSGINRVREGSVLSLRAVVHNLCSWQRICAVVKRKSAVGHLHKPHCRQRPSGIIKM